MDQAHCLALDMEGQLYAWGFDEFCQAVFRVKTNGLEFRVCLAKRGVFRLGSRFVRLIRAVAVLPNAQQHVFSSKKRFRRVLPFSGLLANFCF